MAKATLQFSLPEEERDHLCAVHGRDLVSLLWDFDQELRNKIKYTEEENDPLIPGLEHARERLRILIDEAGLSTLIFEDV